MESSNIGEKFDKMSYPLVIVMRGDDSLDSEKREIASKLAQFLKCSLIDVECTLIDGADIISSLQVKEKDRGYDQHRGYDLPPPRHQGYDQHRGYDLSPPRHRGYYLSRPRHRFNFSIPSRTIEDLAMKIVSKISSIQLSLKLNVIINNMKLSRRHFDHLIKLTTFEGARLLFIQCAKAQSQEEEEKEKAAATAAEEAAAAAKEGKKEEEDDDDVGAFDEHYMSIFGEHVTKLIIDTTKPFVVEEFVPKLLHAAADQESSSSSSREQPSQRMIKQGHAHEFIFIDENQDQKPKKETSCNRCTKLISSSAPRYQCIVCDHFNLHKSCAESPSESGKASYKCKSCKKFSESCNDCLLQAHISWGFFPTICVHETAAAEAIFTEKQHQHPLNFVIMPLWVKFKYLCFACNEMGECVSYKCFSCNLDFHIDCVLPDTCEDLSRSCLPVPDDELTDLLKNYDGAVQCAFRACRFMKKKAYGPLFEAQMMKLFKF